MGEKGNLEAAISAGADSGGTTLIERTTTTIGTVAHGAGSDLVTAVRDGGIDAVADSAIDEVRERVKRTDPATGEGPATDA